MFKKIFTLFLLAALPLTALEEEANPSNSPEPLVLQEDATLTSVLEPSLEEELSMKDSLSFIQPPEPMQPSESSPPSTSTQPPETTKPQKRIENPAPLSKPNVKQQETFPHLESTTKSYESAFMKMILYLAGVLIFVFTVFFIFKKFSSSRVKQSNHFRSIKLLEKRAISPKSMLYLVEIGGKKILLAESQLEIRNVSNLEWIESEKKGL